MNSCAETLPGELSRPEWQISIDQGVRVLAPIISIGSEAARILHQHKHACVLAVFARSFYVQCDQHVFCIGVATLGRGPLQVLLDHDLDMMPFEIVSGVPVDVTVSLPEGAERAVHDRKSSTAESQTRLYSGQVVGISSATCSFRISQEALKFMQPQQQPGFAWIISNTCLYSLESASLGSYACTGVVNVSLAKQSLPALKCLFRWLESARQQPGKHCQNSLSQVSELLGAGPGLTPSGDDLLAGVMLALHRLQRADRVDALWQVLESYLLQRTNIISVAHLRLAARGQCSERVNSLLDHVFSNNSNHHAQGVQAVTANIQLRANSIGASSGWDMLAGMSLVLRTC